MVGFHIRICLRKDLIIGKQEKREYSKKQRVAD